MKLYTVTIDLNSVTYDIEADDKEHAQKIAEENFYEETMYDILKWANFITVERENQ